MLIAAELDVAEVRAPRQGSLYRTPADRCCCCCCREPPKRDTAMAPVTAADGPVAVTGCAGFIGSRECSLCRDSQLSRAVWLAPGTAVRG